MAQIAAIQPSSTKLGDLRRFRFIFTKPSVTSMQGMVARIAVSSSATEKARGEVASSVSCYMKDNPGCTEEDALNYIDGVLDDSFKGLNWEFLKPDNINNDSMSNIKKHAFNIARGAQFFYTNGDGFSDSATDLNDHVRKVIIEPVPII